MQPQTKLPLALVVTGMLLALAASAGAPPAGPVVPGPSDPDKLPVESLHGRALRNPDAPVGRIDRPFDVLHYELDLRVTPDSSWVGGTVRARLVALEALGSVVLDLLDNMVVEDVRYDGAAAAWTHEGDTLAVAVPGGALAPGDSATVAVDYHGFPVREGFVGYRVTVFNDDDFFPDPTQPVLMTLSEPDGARSWWPCHDNPYDAATFDFALTLPDSFQLGLPGTEVERTVWPNGWRRQRHTLGQPVPAYLLSIAAAKYASWRDSTTVHRWPGGEPVVLPIEHFVAPTLEAAGRNSWQNTGKVLNWLEQEFGPYPFPDEKYGHAMFVFGGAMEHPTLSSMGQGTVGVSSDPVTGAPAGEWIMVHEAAHQWFGDCVRLERWGEIWLNEGFARWCEALWQEVEYGFAAYKDRMELFRFPAFSGPVRDPDVLFGSTVYNKGAWILHMLRQVMGREELLLAMRNYVTDPALRFQAVSTSDFQAHCEDVHGGPLDWFFDPWLDRVGRPSLGISWRAEGEDLRVEVEQRAAEDWQLPLVVRLTRPDGSQVKAMLPVPAERNSSFLLPGLADTRVLEADPERDWLVDVEVASSVFPPGRTLVLDAPFPNPFNPTLNISAVVGVAQRVHAEIFDLRGRRVVELFDAEVEPGVLVLQWDGRTAGGARAASGSYVLVVVGSGGEEERRVVTLAK